MTEIINAVAAKVSEYLVAPIGRQLSYLFCYRSYTDELHDKVQKLGKARDDTKLTVNEALQRGDDIRPVVQEWLNRVDEITGEAEELMKDENKSCFNGWCPNLKSRYLLSREADKKAQVIVELQEDRNFPDGVSCRVLPRNVTFKEYESFESRASTLNKIMDALRDDKMKMIGVWGMGGVGKTTLVKQVAEQAKQEKLFTTEVYLQVSWTREPEKIQQGISDIQQNIADMLGLELKEVAIPARAGKLMQRLKNEKILIILDDIWKEVNLEEVGIPSKDLHKDCKIVLASRDEDLLRKDMCAQECFPIQHLQEEEAWHLFKKTAGDSVEGAQLRPIAIEVVDECQGLPIAIVTIAKALKEESVAVWRNALDELRSSAPINIRGVVRMHDVVRDVARNIASKGPHLFVVREDAPLEEWSGTDQSKYISLNCKDVHELPHRLVCPKLQFFLLQNYSPTLNIPNTFFEGMNLLKVLDLSNMHLTTLPPTLHSLANLRTLHLDRCRLGDIALVGELKKLRVLSMVGSNIQQLPSEMGQLTNLRLLDLNDCKELKVIPRNILSSLSRLECLFMKSSSFQWAADGVSDGETSACLSELNYLHHLTTIEIDVPAVKLLPKEDMFFENLTRYAIFIGNFDWFSRNYETSRALKVTAVDGSLFLRDGIGKLLKKTEELELRELEEVCCGTIRQRSFDNLKTLDVWKCDGLKSLFSLSTVQGFSQLEKMKIKFCNALLQVITYERESEIKEDEHDGANLQLFPKLRSLELKFLENLMNFDDFGSELEATSQGMCSQSNLDIDMPFFSYQVSLPNLEELQLSDLHKLKDIWYHQLPFGSFNNLQILHVCYCSCLLNLIPSHLIQRFNNLKKIKVLDCEVLEHVFDLQGLDKNVGILPKLETLELEGLPRLRHITCNDDENDSMRCFFCSSILVDFQNFKHLSIKGCGKEDKDIMLFNENVLLPNLEELQLSNLHKLKDIWYHQLSFGSFNNLQILHVCYCPCLLNLIPSHLIQRFNNLKKIKVINCEVIEQVFDLQGLDKNVGILPKLENLELEGLPRLRHITCRDDENDGVRCFFSSSAPMDFRNLKHLSIKDCGKEDEDIMLFSEKVSFPNLKELQLWSLGKLKRIWYHQLPLGSLNNLQILDVCYCPCLLNLIPSHLIQRFNNLKQIKVFDCEVIEHVFDLQGLDRNVGILSKLETLELEGLPRLRHITCKDDENDSMRCSSSSSTLMDFQNLKHLSIKDCGKEDEDIMLFGEKVLKPSSSVLTCQSENFQHHPAQSGEIYAVPNSLSTAPSSKPRMRWTPEMDEAFLEAVKQLGGSERATPKGILMLMNVEGLTIYDVKSHLQKYRAARYKPELSEGTSDKNLTPIGEITSLDLTMRRGFTEAFRQQIEVQKQLREQLEIQRDLQSRIDEYAKYLPMMFE